MNSLPPLFIEHIRSQLGEEQATPFLASYHEPRTTGLRLNPLKLGESDAAGGFSGTVADMLRRLFRLEPIPWCPEGYYYDEASRPGKHPFHQAGLYYIQEPSAMSAVQLLDPRPGDIVLDLAAAPGGKSTQIAGRLNGQGLLVANEIHPARAKILAENVERLGIANAIVVSSDPDSLSRRLPSAFDKIMLDAPCSGEGMFRKDPDAREEWSPDHVRMCAARQLDILEAAAPMLKPGGTLVYSTCTFNRSENEDVLEAFTAAHPEFTVLRTERLWPHLVRGEGHFVALLGKSGEPGDVLASEAGHTRKKERRARGGQPADKAAREAMATVNAMLAETVPGFTPEAGEPLLFGDRLYWLPSPPGSPLPAGLLDGLKTLRPGLHVAELKKGRAEPAHSLAMALRPEQCRNAVSFAADAPEVSAFLRGETVPASRELSGWTLVAVEGFPLGWGKASEGQIKNHYPKGLRTSGPSVSVVISRTVG
ncbi:RsmB/NOP family class I SAM-dependent RNA methyltransferase [Paenibacillus hodogayensis]|uniref:RsmB/NOP family class I SAM-dependent RNA methyltransferase n=1 Tax=Paenibacillus hodogayensis TaxID=279208 RepID=A0ABV5VXF9_9BACL